MESLQIKNKITNRADNSVLEQYLHDISRLPLINAEQEVELAQRIRNGDEQALNDLVNANLRFVVSVAKNYDGFGVPLMDLISEGNLGLMVAAKRFDASRGFKFISYAVTWIRQYIFSALNNQTRTVRVPVNKLEMSTKVAVASRKLEKELMRPPTISEIADAMQEPEETVAKALQYAKGTVSLDMPVSEDGDCTLLELHPDDHTLTPEQIMHNCQLRDELLGCMSVLPSDEAEVLKLLYGLETDIPMTCGEIGHRMGCSDKKVRCIRDNALKHLRKERTVQMLRP